jgi:multiple sugar transport system substrate-binding protein
VKATKSPRLRKACFFTSFAVTAGDTLGEHLLLALILNNGGGLFTKDRKLDLGSDRNREALTFVGELVQAKSVYPASAGYSGEDAVSAFSQGKGALFLNTPGLSGRLPKIADKIGLVPPLVGPHGDKGTIFWVNNIMLYKQGKHPAETKVFLEWWSEHQKDLWTKGHVSEGALQTLSQSLLQGKDVNSSVKTASDRLKSVLQD